MTIQPCTLPIALWLLLWVTACGNTPESEHAPPKTIAVRVARAEERPFPILYRTTGTVRGSTSAVLAAKTTGYVRAMRVRPGDRVERGQVLVELETRDVRASVARTRAALQQTGESRDEALHALEAAKVAAELAHASHGRIQRLFTKRVVSKQELEDSDARYRSALATEHMLAARLRAAAASVEEARGAVAEVDALLNYSTIVAPFAGWIVARHVDAGALATPAMPLLTLEEEGRLRVEASVEESHRGGLELGATALIEVDAYAEPLSGTIGEIVPLIDATSRTFIAKVDLPNGTQGLGPGTFARVTFSLGTRTRLVAPQSTITSSGALDRAFVADQGHARLRMITLGETDGDWVEVLSGLTSGETLVTFPPPSCATAAKS